MPVLIASGAGGMDIEEVAQKNPEKIIRIHIDPLLGLCDFQMRNAAIGIDLRVVMEKLHWSDQRVVESYVDCDATLAETTRWWSTLKTTWSLWTLKWSLMIIRCFALRPGGLRDMDSDEPAENWSPQVGVTFIKMNGNIGCMVNGAG